MTFQKTKALEKIARLVNIRLDKFAQTSGIFKDMSDACTYKTSSIPTLQAKATYCISLRDQTWIAAQKIIADVKNDVRPVPTKVETVLAELPPPTWP